MPSSLLQVVNNLFQTCHNKLGTSSANTTCWQLVNRLVTTCLQTCNNLCVFTRVPREERCDTTVGLLSEIETMQPWFLVQHSYQLTKLQTAAFKYSLQVRWYIHVNVKCERCQAFSFCFSSNFGYCKSFSESFPIFHVICCIVMSRIWIQLKIFGLDWNTI